MSLLSTAKTWDWKVKIIGNRGENNKNTDGNVYSAWNEIRIMRTHTVKVMRPAKIRPDIYALPDNTLDYITLHKKE